MNKRLHNDEIAKIEDNDLQLRYMLGGLNTKSNTVCNANVFWNCDVRCSCSLVENDEKFSKVKTFINKHNISVDSFFRLLYCQIKNRFCYIDNGRGIINKELDDIINDYDFVCNTKKNIPENDYKDKELLKFVINDIGCIDSPLKMLLINYNLNITDFLVLAKTALLGNYKQHYFWKRKDLFKDLSDILYEYNLYDSLEDIKMYRDKINNNQHIIKKLSKRK